MPNTTHGLWYPDSATKLSPLHTLLSNMQNSVETAMQNADTAAQSAITSSAERDFATAAARDAWYVTHTEVPLQTGIRCRVAGLSYRYVNGAWRVDQQLVEAHLNLVSDNFGVVQWNPGVPLTSVFTEPRYHPSLAPDMLNKALYLDESVALSSGFVNWFLRSSLTGGALVTSRAIFHAVGLIAS